MGSNGEVVKRLKEVTTKIGSGSTPKGGEKSYPLSGVPLIRSMNVRMRAFAWEGIAFIHRETHEEMSGTQVQPNDVLLNITGASIGRVACAPSDLKEANVNQHVAIIRPTPELLPQYLMYWLSQPAIQNLINNQQKGFSRQGYTKAQIEALEIPIRPLSEQRRIVGRIEELTAHLEQAHQTHRQAIAQVGRLFEAGLRSAFSPEEVSDWPAYPMDRLCTAVAGQVDPKEPPYVDMPHVGPDSIEAGTARLLRDTIQTPRQLGLKSGKYLFGPEHVLYSKIRPALRKVALPDFAGVCSADMYPLLPNADLITREFLALSLLSPAFSAYAVDNSDRNAMPKINRAVLNAYQMPVPDKEAQKEIASELFGLKERAERLAAMQAAIDAELASFTPSLLAKAFRGEL